MIEKTDALGAQRHKPSRFGVFSVAAWMSLLGASSAQPQSVVEAQHCSVAQKKPLFVGFAAGMGLENFEATAAASVQIVREVKHWACRETDAAGMNVLGLRRALYHGDVRLERVQFEDSMHAFVMLADAARPRWRVELTQAQDGPWSVTHSRASDASSP